MQHANVAAKLALKRKAKPLEYGVLSLAVR